jgi:hypothetical protein
MEERQHRWVMAVMALNAALFAATFLALGFFNRLSADDFHYLVTTQERGVWGAMVVYYQNWNPRWASTLVLNSLLLAHAKAGSLLLMHCLTLILGWGAFRTLLHGLEARFTIIFPSAQRVLFPFYALMTLFHVSFSKGDTWFWMSSTPMYLWGVFAVALGFGLLLMRSGMAWRYPLATLVFLYVGGSSEPVAVASLIVLFYLGITGTDGNGRRLYHIATIVCLIGFGLDALGSGAQVRMEHLPQLPLAERLFIGMKNYGRLIFLKLPLLLPALVAALLPMAWLWRNAAQWQAVSFKALYVGNRHLFLTADLLMLSISMMMGLVMSDMGPPRAWLPIAVLLMAIGVVLAFRSGALWQRTTKGYLLTVALVGQAVLFGYQVFAAAQMVPKAMRYASAVDGRMEHIHHAIAQGDTLLMLQPLPDSGWLHSAEVSADTANFRNRHLSLFFGNSIRLFVPESIPSESE